MTSRAMKKTGRHTLISLELPDESAALNLAQTIADACSGSVIVVDNSDGAVSAGVKPRL
jgi:hypothetical protein